MKLFMVLLGCKPPGRKTEQHDVFFGIGENLKALVPAIVDSWRGAGKIHIDAWREVNFANGYRVNVIPKQLPADVAESSAEKLFFINLGGYRQNEFDEFHYKMLVAGKDKMSAIQQAKSSAFFRHTGFENAPAHIDDKYGVDVDDMYAIEDILPLPAKALYSIQLSPAEKRVEDLINLGYFVLDKL